MITSYEDGDKVFNLYKAKAKGNLLKNAGPKKIVSAIHELIQGGSPLSPFMVRRIVYSIQIRNKLPSKKQLPLTERELELLELQI